MNHKLFIIILCLVTGNLYARQVITGKVTDKENLKPLESVTLELLQLPDSSILEVTTTGIEGSFILFKGDSANNYCLRIRHISYKPLILPVAKKTGKINNMGVIELEAAVVDMKEVVVNGSKIMIKELPDRTVYTISDGIKKTSVNGIDILRKLPSVQVDYFNENITVEGKSNIKIEVDGVTRDKEYLKKLHPKQIDKFEINTNPSGKYDVETDAVINVVTNSEMRYGLKGMVTTGAIPNSKDNYQGFLNSNLDYGFKKISCYVAGNGGLYNFGFISNSQRVINSSFLNRNSNQAMSGLLGNLNTGFIYDPNEFNNLNFNVSYSKNKQDVEGNVFNYLGADNTVEKIYKTVTQTNNNGGGLNSSLFYKHKFDKTGKQNIEFETNYYYSINNINNTDYQNINFTLDTLDNSSDGWKTERNNSDRRTLSARTSYSTTFDSVYRFGTGINWNYNQNNIDNISSLTNAPDLDFTNIRGTYYIDLSRTFKNGSAKIGTRVENAYVTINVNNKNNYISPLPYTNIQYKPNSKNSFKLSYTRKIFRPSGNNLNPFESLVDSQTISHGNINLKPTYRDNVQVSYSLTYGKGKLTGSLSPQFFYEYRTGLIYRITKINPITGRVENVPENISNGYETGAQLSVNSQIDKVIVNSFFRYAYNHLDPYLDQIKTTDIKSWNWNILLMSPLPYQMNFITSFNMSSPYKNGQEKFESSPIFMLGLVKRFKNNSSLTLIALNPIVNDVGRSKTILQSRDIYQRTDSFMKLKNAILLNYSYNFKLGKEVSVQKRNYDQEIENDFSKLPIKL